MQTIYFGGPVITMENQSDHPEAVLIDNGIIKEIGTLAEVEKKASSNAEKIDLKGKCLMPSFIDAHGHITMNGQMSLCADLSECTCFDDFIEVLKKYITDKNITAKHAVLGFGYDHNFLDEQSHPGKEVLDQVSKDIPIMIMHVSGHLGCVNTAMLNLAGIDENTENPKGGRIGRVAGTNEPDGYLEEAGMMAVQQIMVKKVKASISEMLKGMQRIYIENGVTTVQDGASTIQNIKLLKLTNMINSLKIDVVAYPLMNAGGKEAIEKNSTIDDKYKKHLKIGGYKLVLDGSPQGRSAWMTQPYLGGEEGYCGYPWLTDEEVNAYALQAVNEGRQLLAHCNGDAASDQFLNAYEYAIKESTNPNKDILRPVMIHCQTVRNDQLDRMAKLNMIASIFVGHVYYWGNIHVKNFGLERGHHISPARDALDRGISVNFHQDTPVTKPKMLHSVWCAVNRINRTGEIIGEEQKVTVYEALRAVTIDAAYAYFEEKSKGSIKAGKRADLVLLDKNPLEVDPLEIKDIRVMETIKDGKVIYKR